MSSTTDEPSSSRGLAVNAALRGNDRQPLDHRLAQGGGEDAAKLDVHLVGPEREAWAGQAQYVVARTDDGEMGVLVGHEPTFALLAMGPIRITLEDESQVLGFVDGGFLSVGPMHNGLTRVDVLGDNLLLAEEVTTEMADEDEQLADDFRSRNDLASATLAMRRAAALRSLIAVRSESAGA